MRQLIPGSEIEEVIMQLENAAVESDQDTGDFEENFIRSGVSAGLRYAAGVLEEVLRKPPIGGSNDA